MSVAPFLCNNLFNTSGIIYRRHMSNVHCSRHPLVSLASLVATRRRSIRSLVLFTGVRRRWSGHTRLHTRPIVPRVVLIAISWRGRGVVVLLLRPVVRVVHRSVVAGGSDAQSPAGAAEGDLSVLSAATGGEAAEQEEDDETAADYAAEEDPAAPGGPAVAVFVVELIIVAAGRR